MFENLEHCYSKYQINLIRAGHTLLCTSDLHCIWGWPVRIISSEMTTFKSSPAVKIWPLVSI